MNKHDVRWAVAWFIGLTRKLGLTDYRTSDVNADDIYRMVDRLFTSQGRDG